MSPMEVIGSQPSVCLEVRYSCLERKSPVTGQLTLKKADEHRARNRSVLESTIGTRISGIERVGERNCRLTAAMPERYV